MEFLYISARRLMESTDQRLGVLPCQLRELYGTALLPQRFWLATAQLLKMTDFHCFGSLNRRSSVGHLVPDSEQDVNGRDVRAYTVSGIQLILDALQLLVPR